ncbi:MAG: hypothetical protein ISQ22_03480 [Rhizobiales bacterium]|jgi:uncharacterized membrane protein|nr:hypothetical protein [Hyphomicrobiales bacterium]
MNEIENTEQNVRSTRGLKIAIFIMTLLLIVGFCVVFLTIGYRLSNNSSVTQDITSSNVVIEIDPKEEIFSFSNDQKYIHILTVDEQKNYTIYNFDKRSNQLISTIELNR